MEQRLLNLADVAIILRVGVVQEYMYMLCNHGDIQTVRFGKSARVRSEDPAHT